ncbi:MAG: hypothetical protein IIA87_02040 [Nanoarchaeota archaeon]|nr:hypothetical protein [Nanoarchaeota archaeon]
MVKKITFNNGGQISIFVIVAILLVVAIGLFFAVFKGTPKISIGEEFEPESFISQCVRKSARETIDVMLPQGGFVNPSDYKIYNDVKATYLCKNINYYDPCVHQHPLYITELEQEIKGDIQENIEGCFMTLQSELDKRNYQISGERSFHTEVVLKPGKVEVTVFREFSLSKNNVEKRFTSFSTSVRSPLYDIALVVQEIIRQEAQFCYFENLGFSLLYNDFDIKKFSMSDSTKIYTIKDKKSGKEMNMAIRGCAIPAGF